VHELAICQAFVSQVEDIAGQQTAWVRQVGVGIGPLSGNRAATAGKRISAGLCRYYASGRFAETALQRHRGKFTAAFPIEHVRRLIATSEATRR